MELTTLYKQYRAAKMAADQAAKEEDKLKKALKKAMEEAGVKNYTDEDGFLFERIVQNRKSMDESGDMSPVWRLDHLEKMYNKFLREVTVHGK